jgi:hypothetical protein
VIRACLKDFAGTPLFFELWQLEGNLYRVFYKLTYVEEAMRQLMRELVSAKTRLLQEEDLVFNAPSEAGERVATVERLAEDAYRRLRLADPESLKHLNETLLAVERDNEDRFVQAVSSQPQDQRDLSWYESYNRPFDYASSGLCSVLADEFDLSYAILDEEVIALAAAKMKRRGEHYAVNHVDRLIVRWCAAEGRIVVAPEARSALPGGLEHERARGIAMKVFVHPGQPGSTGVRLWGEVAPGEYGELFVDLDLDKLALRVTGGGSLA